MRRLTDHNLENPFRTTEFLTRDEVKNTIYLFQSEYDAIGKKDPYTFYVIRDSGEVFRGEDKVVTPSYNHKISGKYFISNNENNEFVLFLNYQTFDHRSFLIEIERYDDLVAAVYSMKLYNRVNSHSKRTIRLFMLIENLINKKIGLADCIYGIISEFGFKEHGLFQEMLRVIDSYYNSFESRQEVPNAIKVKECDLIHSENFLFKYFFGVYRILEENKVRFNKFIKDDDINQLVEKIIDLFYKR